MHTDLSLYHITRPSNLKHNAPLLIMLHGYGSDENDLFSFVSELPKEFYIISVRAPLKMYPYGNTWYTINFEAEQGKWSNTDEAITSRELIIRFIDEACKAYPVNSNHVTLLGFSQGTILSFAVALSYPEKVKHIVALSGYINEAILVDNYKAKNHTHLDFFCSHGYMDQVIPVDWARHAPKFLKSLNIKHQYKEYAVGHGVAPQNFYDVKNWLKLKL